MLTASLLSSTLADDVTSILPICETAKLLVSTAAGDVLVYAFEGHTLKLSHTYSHLLKRNDTDTVINHLLYSDQLSTVFAICEKSIVLLNSTNLNQFDKIVDKRGIQQAWVLEKCSESCHTTTALLYRSKKASSLKLFLWKDRTFNSVLEVNLSSKDEVVMSAEMDRSGFIIATNRGTYQWKLNNTHLNIIEKIVSPTYPHSIHDAIKEMESHKFRSGKTSEPIASSSESILSRKMSFRQFFKSHEANGELQNKKLVFQPASQPHLRMMDGKQKKIYELIVNDSKLTYMSVRDGHGFFEANSGFDCMQYLSSKFLLLNNKKSVRIVDYEFGFPYLDLQVEEGIKKVYQMPNSTLLVWTCEDNLQIYRVFITDESDASSDEAAYQELENLGMSLTMKKIIFCEAILYPHDRVALCESFECDDLEETLDLYALKLRDLNVLWSLSCFERCQKCFEQVPRDPNLVRRLSKLQGFVIKGIFEIFIKFLAPPELVICYCFTEFMPDALQDGMLRDTSVFNNEPIEEVPTQYIIKWCIPYLTDTRRVLYNLACGKKVEWKLEDREIKVGISFFQINHGQELDVSMLLKMVDTTLFNVYLKFNPSMIGPFTRVKNSCDFETVEKQLLKHKRIQELVDFYYQRGEHELALKLLIGLESQIKSEHQSDVANDIKTVVVEYIKKLPEQESDTIFKYTKWLIEKFPEDKDFVISSVFMNFSPNCSRYNFINAYDFIDDFDKSLSLKYLEFVIDAFKTTQKKVYMNLIQRYLENIHDEKNARKLEALLRSTDCYEPRTVLRLFQNFIDSDESNNGVDRLVKRLKVYPLKIMGEHAQSLAILVEDLSNYNLASAYCYDVYITDADTGLSLFSKLLDKLIKKATHNDGDFKNVLKFLREHGPRLDSIETLKKLPADMKLKDLNQILSKEIEASSNRRYTSRMERNLLQVALVDKTYQLNNELTKYCIIGEAQRCYVCHKHLKCSTGETLLMYDTPSSELVTHYNCGKSMEQLLQAKKGNRHRVWGDLLK
ncbi:LAQU0S01e02080g1_1 [Lachancea quebecensis]|uniref:LAQU0S01e02080g1_1 n=1 Tax=Lachancea quebecensis TaxID=1654605 RepID=A0A0P1KKU3_9SACH|nr:LAQU0S01e02080g1_1 [Lachancea quebecensis]